MARVSCPFAPLGCETMLTRGTRERHEKMAVNEHMLLLLSWRKNGSDNTNTTHNQDFRDLPPKGSICKNANCTKTLASLREAVERHDAELRKMERVLFSIGTTHN